MIDKRLKLLLPSKPQSLYAVREEVQSFISRTPYETRATDIVLVVSEACTNVVRHAYPKSCKKALVTIECILKDDYLTIMVYDQGRGLTSTTGRSVFSEDGGFGLFLMQRLADRFRCHSAPGTGTVVELAFKNHENHALRLNKRMAYAFVEPASAFVLSFADMFYHPRRNLQAYRAYFEDGVSSAIDNLKSHWKAIVALLFIRARLGDLEKAIKTKKYAAAKVIAEDIDDEIKVVRQGYCHVPPEGQFALKGYLEYACSKLSHLEKILEGGEFTEVPGQSGTSILTEKCEIADILALAAHNICKLAHEETSCWVSLDKETMRLI